MPQSDSHLYIIVNEDGESFLKRTPLSPLEIEYLNQGFIFSIYNTLT